MARYSSQYVCTKVTRVHVVEVIVALAVVEVIVSILVGIVKVPPLQLLIFKFSRLSRKFE